MTPTGIRAAQAEHNDDPFLVLLTFKLQPEAEDVRVVNNTQDITSRGQVFIGCPFSIALPDSNESVITEARLAIDNVDTRIWQGIRALNAAPEVLIEVVLASEPDTIMLATDSLKLREATASVRQIQGKLVPDSVWTAGFPAHEFDPAQNAGLFGTGGAQLARLGSSR